MKSTTCYGLEDNYSSNEGWANVLLESMACGTPVVATDVGGNSEVIENESLGIIIPYGDAQALEEAIRVALSKPWDQGVLVRHARKRSWEQVADEVLSTFSQVHKMHRGDPPREFGNAKGLS